MLTRVCESRYSECICLQYFKSHQCAGKLKFLSISVFRTTLRILEHLGDAAAAEAANLIGKVFRLDEIQIQFIWRHMRLVANNYIISGVWKLPDLTHMHPNTFTRSAIWVWGITEIFSRNHDNPNANPLQ